MNSTGLQKCLIKSYLSEVIAEQILSREFNWFKTCENKHALPMVESGMKREIHFFQVSMSILQVMEREENNENLHLEKFWTRSEFNSC